MSSVDCAPPILVLDRVCVDYGINQVRLNEVSLQIATGSMHAIVGDRGAGKSTLIKTISGVIPKTSGTLLFEDRVLDNHSPDKAIKLGIVSIYQENTLIPSMKVYENVFFKREIRRGRLLYDHRRMRQQTQEALRELSCDLDPATPVAACNMLQRQIVEMARIQCSNPKMVLIDELSGRLYPEELEKFHHILSLLRSRGVTIVYVAHNIDEVFDLANRVTVLKGGSVIQTEDVSHVDKMQLLRLTYSSIRNRREIERDNLRLFYLKNFYDIVMQHIPLPMIVVDSDRTVVAASDPLLKYAGVAREALIGQLVEQRLSLVDRSWPTVAEALRALEPVHPCAAQLQLGAESRPCQVSMIPLAGPEFAFVGTILILSPPQEAAPFSGQVQTLGRRVPYSQSIAGIAHELNNPLGIVLNYLKLMRSEPQLAQVRDHAEAVEHEVLRIRSILKRLLASGSPPDQAPSTCSVQAIADGIIGMLRPTMESQGIEVSVAVERNVPLRIEAELLKQLLVNVLLNSVEAMPCGGRLSLDIRCGGSSPPGCALIEVRDTGVGIPRENLQRIFEPFFSTKSDRGDRGLGLAIVRDILEQAGGSIEVDSSPGEGSVFRLVLPVQRDTQGGKERLK